MVSFIGLWDSLKETVQNLGTISLILIFVIIIILIILMIIERNLKKKIIVKKSRNDFYLDAIEKLSQKNPLKTLKKIDNITTEFFKECFRVKNSKGYSELNEFFLKKKNKEIADFCNEINNMLYSGKKITDESNQKLISKLTSIIKNNPIPAKQKNKRKSKKTKK